MKINKQGKPVFKETVSSKKKFLSSLIKAPFAQIEQESTLLWDDCDELTRYLSNSLSRLPHCQLLYAINTDGTQYSGNVTRYGVDNSWQSQDLSDRPYMNANLPYRGMILSAAYLSQRSMQPCMTVVQAINLEGKLLGFLAADFHLKDLPVISTSTLQRMHVQNSQHHPASGASPKNRAGTKNGKSIASAADANIDYLIFALSTLMQEHGIFHCKVHFTSESCHLWSEQNSYAYQLHTIEQIMSSELLEHYPACDYHARNGVPSDKIPLVLAQFKAMRQADDIIYLRSGSLNLVNGLVGLSFSCDGSHYLDVDEFLNHDLAFWLNQDHLLEQQVYEQSKQN